MAGAPLGNQNAANGKKWRAAIDRALDIKSRADGKDALDAVASSLITQALAGEQWAVKELGDRLDGRVAQALEVGGPNGGSIPLSVSVSFVSSTA